MEKKTEVSQEKIVQSIPMSSLLQTAAALRKAGKFDLAKKLASQLDSIRKKYWEMITSNNTTKQA